MQRSPLPATAEEIASAVPVAQTASQSARPLPVPSVSTQQPHDSPAIMGLLSDIAQSQRDLASRMTTIEHKVNSVSQPTSAQAVPPQVSTQQLINPATSTSLGATALPTVQC